MEPAFRPAGVEEIPIPSIAHLRPGHFAANVGEANGRYMLDDPLLGGEVWVTAAALREQSSGYFLVPEGEAPAGWTAPPSATPLDGAGPFTSIGRKITASATRTMAPINRCFRAVSTEES